MTYFYTCPDCGASTMVDTDDNDYAGKALAKFQRKHNCKVNYEPLATQNQAGILHAGQRSN